MGENFCALAKILLAQVKFGVSAYFLGICHEVKSFQGKALQFELICKIRKFCYTVSLHVSSYILIFCLGTY